MEWRSILGTAVPVVYAAGSVWFYLHCVRPALLWHRARWIAQPLFAVLSILPAAVSVTGQVNLLPVVSFVTWIGLAGAWLFPALAIRATGGRALAVRGVDQVFGWLFPAGEHLDVGDLEAARVQVDEARRHAPPEALPYVDLWETLVRDEERRRNGERISRTANVKAIQEEYSRLVLERDAIAPFWEAAVVVAVGAVTWVSTVNSSMQ